MAEPLNTQTAEYLTPPPNPFKICKNRENVHPLEKLSWPQAVPTCSVAKAFHMSFLLSTPVLVTNHTVYPSVKPYIFQPWCKAQFFLQTFQSVRVTDHQYCKRLQKPFGHTPSILQTGLSRGQHKVTQEISSRSRTRTQISWDSGEGLFLYITLFSLIHLLFESNIVIGFQGLQSTDFQTLFKKSMSFIVTVIKNED